MRYEALLLLLKEHKGKPDAINHQYSTKEELDDYDGLLKERKQLLNEMGRKK